MIDKLQWCKENAPEALRTLPDKELLEVMNSAWEKFGRESVYESVPMNTEEDEGLKRAPINKQLDIMVRYLAEQLGNKVAFKGGYMLTKLLPNIARQTADIDFSIQNSELYKDLIKYMQFIGDKFIELGFISRYEIKPEVKQRSSGGMTMYDINGTNILGIDIGWHDLSFGTTTVNMKVGSVTAFSVERMLSDKLTAILSRKRFRRSKDLYDFLCITNCFDFNTKLLSDYIIKRTEGVGAEWRNYPFSEEVLVQYKKAYDSLKVVNVYGKSLEKPGFNEALDRVAVVANVLLSGECLVWSHKERCFHEE